MRKKNCLIKIASMLLALSLFIGGISESTVLADTIENIQAPETTENTETTETPEIPAPKFTVKEYQTPKSKYVTASKITAFRRL